jgi:hypothetical protein
MKSICTIIVLTGVMLMLMSTTAMLGVGKAKHRKSKPAGKESLISQPVRYVIATNLA